MLILMAGLPATGKSTLSNELAKRLSGIVFNKDQIRSAIFSPSEIEYSVEQDDLIQKIMLDAATYVLQKNPGRYVFLDGRPFSKRYQIEQAIAVANSLNQPWRILECICSDETARKRLEAQRATAEHPAANRDYGLYLRMKAEFEEITRPKAVINTERDLDQCVRSAIQALC
jgi:predicted kinase